MDASGRSSGIVSTTSGGRSPTSEMVRFVVFFAVFLVIANVLIVVPWIERVLVVPWTRLNAAAAAAFASLLGIPTEVNGTTVSSGGTSLNILLGCNGIHALAILLSAVLAFPSSLGRRLLGVAGGTVAILGANLVRLVNLIFVARYHPAQLELFHIYIWQTLIVLIAFGLFLTWGFYLADPAPTRSAAGTADR